METVERYLAAGIDRVILGTAAVTEPDFAQRAVEKYGEKIAVGIDIKDGFAAIRGWEEKSALTATALCEKMQRMGVKTLICTDIARDGAMEGTNHGLYRQLMADFDMQIIASGGVSSLADVKRLSGAGPPRWPWRNTIPAAARTSWCFTISPPPPKGAGSLPIF